MEKYFRIQILRGLCPAVRNVEYIISSQPFLNHKTLDRFNSSSKETRAEPQLEFEEIYIDKKFNLNPRYTFDNFIVGSFNELARAAAIAVTKNLGSAYNPLLVYGGTGLGKTHLLHAIGNQIKKDDVGKKIHYLTSEKFANEYINAIQSGTTSSLNASTKITPGENMHIGIVGARRDFDAVINYLQSVGRSKIMSSPSRMSDAATSMSDSHSNRAIVTTTPSLQMDVTSVTPVITLTVSSSGRATSFSRSSGPTPE